MFSKLPFPGCPGDLRCQPEVKQSIPGTQERKNTSGSQDNESDEQYVLLTADKRSHLADSKTHRCCGQNKHGVGDETELCDRDLLPPGKPLARVRRLPLILRATPEVNDVPFRGFPLSK